MTFSANTFADSTQARQRLWEMIKDIRFGMLTTRHSDGHLNSRPVTTQNSRLDEDSSLWFFLSRDGEPLAELTADPVVNVAYADPQADCYVSISGTSALVEDLAKKHQLWSKMAQAWFPEGPTDPNLALVQVRIFNAHYWDIHASKIVQLFHKAKAALTGKPPTELGKEAEIDLE